MRKKPRRFKLFEIPSSEGVVEIELMDGSVGVYDRDGESYYDGWATVDDIAWQLETRIPLPGDEAKRVAAEAVRRWEGWRDDAPGQSN